MRKRLAQIVFDTNTSPLEVISLVGGIAAFVSTLLPALQAPSPQLSFLLANITSRAGYLAMAGALIIGHAVALFVDDGQRYGLRAVVSVYAGFVWLYFLITLLSLRSTGYSGNIALCIASAWSTLRLAHDWQIKRLSPSIKK